MNHTCPQCGSRKVRHAGSHEARHFLRTVFRCRRCNAQFLAIAGRTWLRLGATAVVLAVVAFTALVLWQFDRGDDSVDVVQKLAAARARDGSEDYVDAQKYLAGNGVARDLKQGVVLLERAAQQGHLKAQYELAVALRDGSGVMADEERALTWFRIAAEAGDARAQHQVGLMYLQGRGTRADPVKGYAWLSIAAANGDTEAAQARDAAQAGLSEVDVTLGKNEARRLATAQRVARDKVTGQN